VLGSPNWRYTRTWSGRLAAVVAAAAIAGASPAVPAFAGTNVAGPSFAGPAFVGPAFPGTAFGGPAFAGPALARPGPASLLSPGPKAIYARGAALADVGTGQQLWSKDPGVRRPMGSIVKVMTALVVLSEGHLNQQVTVTKAAIRYVHKDGASSAGLIRGDVLTVRQLLEAMLLPSGCDAAYLLATAYGPGRPAFVRKMNAMAKSIGMTSTHFTSFDGMPFPTEYSTYSTPADLIRLGEQAMRSPLFRRIVAQRSHVLAATALHHRYAWQTTNQLLLTYRGATGIKTGDTNAAGNCLLFEARRGSVTLIGVVLHGDPSDNFTALFNAASRLLNWGFRRT
jgi:serine-type D-Ala-D-Ala carboxypeptidase (penicillin-binding protein 5/6)